MLCASAASAQRLPKLKVKVGLMLPYTGTYASLGTAIENGFKQYVNQVKSARSAIYTGTISYIFHSISSMFCAVGFCQPGLF